MQILFSPEYLAFVLIAYVLIRGEIKPKEIYDRD